jgi:peptide/nickel transport system permease protein
MTDTGAGPGPPGPIAPLDRTGGYLGPAGQAAVAAASRATPARWRLLLGRPTFFIGAGILLFWVVCAVFGHLIAPYNPLAQNLLSANAAPSSAHWFGTDPLGRDVLSRVIVGARDILIITPLATVLGTILGTALGLAMGYFGGAFDLVAGRIVEALLALPFVIIAFLFVVALGPSIPVITVIIGLVFTPLIARTVRAAVLVERNQDYVPASRLLGENSTRVMFAEILPNIMPAIVVEFTVRLGYAVFAVATLSFLGFGIQPPIPDWGADIAANYVNLPAGFWWQVLFPAVAIASLVTAVIFIADSIEQVLSA